MSRDLQLVVAFYYAVPQRGPEACMVTKDVSVPGTPFDIERIWVEDGRLFYTRQGDSLVSTGPEQARGESAHRRPARDPQGFEVTWLILSATSLCDKTILSRQAECRISTPVVPIVCASEVSRNCAFSPTS